MTKTSGKNGRRLSASSRVAAVPASARLAVRSGVVAGATATFAEICASYGLFALSPAWLMPVLVCIVTGAASALVSGARWKSAAVGTVIGSMVGAIVAPPFVGGLAGGIGVRLMPAMAIALVAGVSAAAAAMMLHRAPSRDRAEWVLSLVLLAMVVGGLWTATAAFNSGAHSAPETSLDYILSVRPEIGNTVEDHNVYLRLYHDLRDGKPYYSSFLNIFLADPSRGNAPPPGITGYRLPTIFYLWLLLPSAQTLPWAFLVFATVAVLSAFLIGVQLSRPSTAILAPLAVAPAFLYVASTTYVTFVDGWAVAIALAGIAFYIVSIRSRSRTLLWCAVGTLLFAALLREIMVYPMALALSATLLLPKSRRWTEAWPWLVGLACFVAAYAAHALAIGGRVDPAEGYDFWLHGGIPHLVATLRFFEYTYGAKPWFVPALVLLGIVGGLTVWRNDRRLGAFLTAAVALPLATFTIVGNGGVLIATGEVLGYWGILVVPIALTLIPASADRALVALRLREARSVDRADGVAGAQERSRPRAR